MKFTFKTTIVSCFIAYIVQAVVNNFSPLLFITFNETYQIPLSQITLLVSINFAVQLTVDLLATKYVDRIGYRPCIVAAHFFAASGLCLLAILPEYMEPFTGLMIAGCTYAIGGGLIEVLISPIMERCHTDKLCQHKGWYGQFVQQWVCVHKQIKKVFEITQFQSFGQADHCGFTCARRQKTEVYNGKNCHCNTAKCCDFFLFIFCQHIHCHCTYHSDGNNCRNR